MDADRAGKKILIIDDDARNIFALNAVLKAKGFACVSAQSAAEGFKKIAELNGSTGVVLLDMMMPEMDGYEMLNVIRGGEFSSTPVIAVTAQAMAGDKERCIAAGADGYVSKPVDVDQLITILNKYF